MTSFTARALATNRLQQVIVQATHGFVVGNVIINDALAGPPDYIKARASSMDECFGSMMVSQVIDPDTFVATQVGKVTNITSQILIAGENYWLSPTTAGLLTTTKPTSVGEVVLGLLKADTTDSGFFFGGVGELIESPTAFMWNTVTGDTALVANNGYIFNAVTDHNFTLPVNFAVGDVIEIKAISTGKITVLQNGGQSMILGNGGPTTVGVGGSIAGTTSYQSITLTGGIADALMYADAASAFIAT